MQLLGIVIIYCLGFSTAQQMCVYQNNWRLANSVITFDSASTLFTSSMQDSKIDVSKMNTTGEIIVKTPHVDFGRVEVAHPGISNSEDEESRIRLMSLIVLVGYHPTIKDSLSSAQVFVQKNGKVSLTETRHRYDSSGGLIRYEATVGLPNSELQEKKLGYLMLDTQKNMKELRETGYLAPGDTIRLVTGKVDDGYLDASVCILYN